ncbi:sirohydrochlorin chelatase [Sporosarcina sp. JAI121]|uniref:sirohydrochlorin chelatase n=1 Tax=Sporosarcina sp. JAI121 TaxID=2723064 RepID=UPI0015CBCCB6|nr:sirohydrochlorin chelatase [Sporosarcina sp. JAI121]NYF24778.1 sirohydrochlorin ferrochelatase [Sporosarcina sp. JAI121]
MQAILYVCHGSRVKAGVEEAIQFIRSSQALIDVPIQEICFLELAAPSVNEGIAKCVDQGATKIAVVPILLLSAIHAKDDIPFEIEVGRIMYPDVEFTYGRPFGIHPKIVDSLYDRVLEQKITIAEDAQVLLIGRGSSDPAVKQDLTEIARLLRDNYAFNKVEVCFLYGAAPHFDEVLQQLQQVSQKQVFIIPYLLFTGILMNGIEKKITQQSTGANRLILCHSLGYHENIRDILVERVTELLESEKSCYIS